MPAPRFLLLFFLLGFVCPDAAAQQYRAFARRYGIEEGLPHRQVNNLFQDRRGFIWAATNAGVARFDGRRFKVFNKTENGLGGDLVEWGAEDARGNIWAHRSGKNGWLNILDPVSGALIPPTEYFKTQPPPVSWSKWWKTPLQAPDSALIFSLIDTTCGILRFHPNQGWSYTQVPDCTSFLPLKVTTRNTVWGLIGKNDVVAILAEIGLDGAILRQFESKPGCFFWNPKGSTSHPDGFLILEMCADGGETIWEIGADGQRREVNFPAKKPFIHQLACLEKSGIKVRFPYIFDEDDRLLLDITREYPEIDMAQYRDYLLDRNGNIWFATTFGLIVVELRKNHFHRLLYDENATGGRGMACRGLLEKNGRLLVNLETFRQGRFRVDPRTGAAERLAGNCGIGIAESADGNVWTECLLGGNGWQTLSLYKAKADGQLTGLCLVQKKDYGYIWSILDESPRRVLLGHMNGITVFNPLDSTAAAWHDERFPEFDHANVSWLGKDRRGQIWACAEQGLFQLKPGGGVAARYWSGGTGANYLPYDNIYHFYEDAAGVFWLGTGGGGLIRWDPHAPPGQHTQVIFRKNGLLNGVVYAAYEDRHEHLWLPTDYGIVQLDKKTLQVRHTWLTADGLSHNEFNRVSHCRGADSTLYFGGLNGVTAFQPDDFYAAGDAGKSGLRLAVCEFSVLDPSSGRLENRTADLLRTNRITLQPDDRYVQLEFSLLEYFTPEKVTYTWKLEGVAAEWENLNEPVLRLSGLPFGEHRLRIRARAADGTLAANEINIGLTVLPPFYLRWWFILGTILLAVAGMYGWFRWRTRAHRRAQLRLENEVQRQTMTIRHQTEELKKLDQAKSRFFANVSHELRTPLTLILGPLGSLLKGKRLDPRDTAYAHMAREHGEQLLRLVNEILDLSKMESGNMKLHETAVSLQPFLRRVVGAFESHAERLGIQFVFEYRVPARLRVLVDEDKLQKVLNNLLANALKFTPAHSGGSLRVRIDETDGFIRLGVHDTGRGIHPEDLPRVFERFYQTAQPGAPVEGGTGIGLALCREFADVMQGRIWVESTLGAGSSFYFEFPQKEVLGVGSAEYGVGSTEYGVGNDGAPESELIPADTAPDDPVFSGEDTADGVKSAGLSLVSSGKHRETILLVEDNDSLRDYVKAILSEKYEVITAENGQVALQLLESHTPHSALRTPHSALRTPYSALRTPQLILSDVMMPVMDGFQLLETLKGDDRWRHIPVVMLTARADLRDKLRALRTGVDDYLLKPFEEDELLARVENLLLNYSRRRTADGPRPATVRRSPTDPPTNQPVNQSTNQPVNQSTNQPVNQSTNQPINQSTNQPVTKEDQAWLEAFEQVVDKQLGDFHLTAETLADAMALSRATFFRQLKRLTGLTPAQYLDEARFQKARYLLENRQATSVKAAAYSVGFRQVKHFSQNYKKRFGKSPSEYGG